MALIKCPECGNNVSDKAKSCIHCGYPLGELGTGDSIENFIAEQNTATDVFKRIVVKYLLNGFEPLERSDDAPDVFPFKYTFPNGEWFVCRNYFDGELWEFDALPLILFKKDANPRITKIVAESLNDDEDIINEVTVYTDDTGATAVGLTGRCPVKLVAVVDETDDFIDLQIKSILREAYMIMHLFPKDTNTATTTAAPTDSVEPSSQNRTNPPQTAPSTGNDDTPVSDFISFTAVSFTVIAIVLGIMIWVAAM